MLRALHIEVVGSELIQFVDKIDYTGFLASGGTPEQWERCINALFEGFPGYDGKQNYNQYLREQADFLDLKYRVFDAKNTSGEVVE